MNIEKSDRMPEHVRLEKKIFSESQPQQNIFCDHLPKFET
jgi:hypothetical protein